MNRQLAILICGCLTLGLVLPSASGSAAPFTYKPHGQLIGNSGTGLKSTKDYVPGMRFPIEKAPAYANSQVYMAGGSKGPGGGQCAAMNYSYPWWDNYCEYRSWKMPLCPSGKGHQGQDIRPGSCKFNTHWVVAVEDGTITSIGTYSVYQKSITGVTHRYLHMKMNALKVYKGQKVKKGQRLGLVDNDFGGTATTLHLHYDRKAYVAGVGTVYLPTYASLVNSYKKLLGPTCDAAACAKKSSCGAWGKCGGFSAVCDATGVRKRTCTQWACTGSKCASTAKVESQACTVKTDGKQVSGWSAWGACAQGGTGCDGTGSRTRSRKVCKSGKPTVLTEQSGCVVPTDGKALSSWSAWTPCDGFVGICGETGSRTRKRSECKAGKAVTITQNGVCKVDKSWQEVSAWTPWSLCIGKGGPCDAAGTRSRKREICHGGKVRTDTATEVCTQSKEGMPLGQWSDWGPCVAEESPCAATGKQTRSQKQCQSGAPGVGQQTQPCVPDCASDGWSAPGQGDAIGAAKRDSGGGAVDSSLASRPSSGCSARRTADDSTPAPLAVLVLLCGLLAYRRRWSGDRVAS
ncbi:MAG: M23 family metallopeptidase [Myxococcales bacterium]|nr:M23 family metallopeptidase [Myxococcales bacterium]